MTRLAYAILIATMMGCVPKDNTPQSSSSTSSSIQSSSSSSSVEIEQPKARCDDNLAAQNKATAEAALNGLFVQKNVSAINQYWGEPYSQHNPIAKSGVEAFRSIMGSFVTQSSFNYQQIRIFAECDLVIVQGKYSSSGVIFDMFRVKNGKLVEHWDSDSNQASATTGPTSISDPSATHRNREKINRFYEKGLIANAPSVIASFFSSDATIHRVTNAQGSDAFAKHLSGSGIVYKKVHHVIADGDFVFVLAEGTLNNRAYAFYDLYRLEYENIVEHWDSRRVVPSSTQSGLGIF